MEIEEVNCVLIIMFSLYNVSRTNKTIYSQIWKWIEKFTLLLFLVTWAMRGNIQLKKSKNSLILILMFWILVIRCLLIRSCISHPSKNPIR